MRRAALGRAGTPKAKVVILGGGNVGTNACKIAVGMGADVTVIDMNLARLAYLDDLFGARIQTLYSTDAVIEKAVAEADLVVGCVLIPGKAAPKLMKREYLKKMKAGSVIVDVAVDQGGCCETTKVTYHDDPIYTVDGVIHYCVGNMPGAVPAHLYDSTYECNFKIWVTDCRKGTGKGVSGQSGHLLGSQYV